MKITIAVMFITTVFAACKKDNDAPKDSFDPAKYYIVATKKNSPAAQLGGIITFDAGGNCDAYNMEELYPDVFKYQYINGHIKITDGMDESVFADITIANGQIQNITSPTNEFVNYDVKIYKIPEANAFTGKTFSGAYYFISNNNPAGSTTFNFTDTKWTSPTGQSDSYVMHNAAIASSPSVENRSDVFHFVIVDGKLLFYNIARNTYGEVNPQS